MYISLAMVTEANALFEKYSDIADKNDHKWKSWRAIIKDKSKKGSIVYLQHNTSKKGNFFFVIVILSTG